MTHPTQIPAVLSVDGEERIGDFLARHGGAGARAEREGDMAQHAEGWWRYAADGYLLRCDSSKLSAAGWP